MSCGREIDGMKHKKPSYRSAVGGYKTYHDTFGGAVAEMIDYAERIGVEFDGESPESYYWEHTGYGETTSKSFEISKYLGKNTRKGFHTSTYCLDSGRYELTIYCL